MDCEKRKSKKIKLSSVSATEKNTAIVTKCYLQKDVNNTPFSTDIYIALKNTTDLARIRVKDYGMQKELYKALHAEPLHMVEIELSGLSLYQKGNKIYGYAESYIIL